jgi:hypothetical protein
MPLKIDYFMNSLNCSLSLILMMLTGCAHVDKLDANNSAPHTMEINTADNRQIEEFKGVGPLLGKRIIVEREKQRFENCADLISRVKGIGPLAARKYSESGLRVNGQICD